MLEIEREGHPQVTASRAVMPSSDPDASLVMGPRSVASEGAAQQGYDQALEAVPPPAQGFRVPKLRLTRPQPTVDDLQERLEGMLVAMSVELEPGQAAAWAQQAQTADPSPDSPASIAEAQPGVIVTYDAWFDDLSVVDTTRWAEDGGQVDAVPWAVANDVMDALVAQGLIDATLSYDEISISYVRSGVKGPDGSHEEWVEEVRFQANGQLDGAAFLDVGVRVGITPKQRVSSLRLTRIEIKPQDPQEPVVVAASEEELRRSFATHVAESTDANVESVLVSARRPVYMLDPLSSSELVAPQYMIDYALTIGTGDEDRMGSRAKMAFLSLTDALPSVELELP